MVLSPPTIAANGTASLDLSLYSERGKEPATIQWTFQYPSSSIATLRVDDGPALTSAGKTLMCAANTVGQNCLAVGTNANAIGNGIIAKLTAVLAPEATTATILITSTLGASSAGYLTPVASRIMLDRDLGVPPPCKPLQVRRRPSENK
jgi:hypothetical protein